MKWTCAKNNENPHPDTDEAEQVEEASIYCLEEAFAIDLSRALLEVVVYLYSGHRSPTTLPTTAGTTRIDTSSR